MRRPVTSRTIVAAMAAGLAVTSVMAFVTQAQAQDINYESLFKDKVLKCLHPTVKVDSASVEVVRGPSKDGDISTTRLKVFYSGLIRKNSMDVDIIVREAGSVREMKVNVLADTATGLASCDLTKHWSDF